MTEIPIIGKHPLLSEEVKLAALSTMRTYAEIADYFRGPSVKLYDVYEREIEVPSSAPKIGDTITVKRPKHWTK